MYVCPCNSLSVSLPYVGLSVPYVCLCACLSHYNIMYACLSVCLFVFNLCLCVCLSACTDVCSLLTYTLHMYYCSICNYPILINADQPAAFSQC